MLGAEIWLKFENLQYTASFKDRGSLFKLSSMSEAELKAGLSRPPLEITPKASPITRKGSARPPQS